MIGALAARYPVEQRCARKRNGGAPNGRPEHPRKPHVIGDSEIHEIAEAREEWFVCASQFLLRRKLADWLRVRIISNQQGQASQEKQGRNETEHRRQPVQPAAQVWPPS